jgi:hypothetical protein
MTRGDAEVAQVHDDRARFYHTMAPVSIGPAKRDDATFNERRDRRDRRYAQTAAQTRCAHLASFCP